ncbi:hypothetical protein SAMN02745133_02254 [Desulforamulus putei DSM 12395]|uniref:DUF4083 domain-containing protein n=1 Tax=Desulforamulus putei DSM 12395 TaxID=1121429 RepID=A0A1M5AEJ3_9FIRM|nr:hypothetical protein [Desulforamulus putei]SHF28643.1 hypothetical protein SAMN02745133_02254 [Desulforamulus putei DSM 12395]
MEGLGLNATLLAQLFNFIVLVLIMAVFGRLVYVLLTGRTSRKQFGKMEEELREIKTRLGEIEKKLDKKG